MTARSSEKPMDVIDVTPPGEDSVLFCGMTTKAKDTIMKEWTWIRRVACEMVCCYVVRGGSLCTEPYADEVHCRPWEVHSARNRTAMKFSQQLVRLPRRFWRLTYPSLNHPLRRRHWAVKSRSCRWTVAVPARVFLL